MRLNVLFFGEGWERLVMYRLRKPKMEVINLHFLRTAANRGLNMLCRTLGSKKAQTGTFSFEVLQGSNNMERWKCRPAECEQQ